jgi:hypothetical protein
MAEPALPADPELILTLSPRMPPFLG